MNRMCVVVVGLAVGLTGCTGSKDNKVQARPQIGEDSAADPDAFATVGMKTVPDNMGPIAVSGVGLVYRLQPGTGSSAPAGAWREMLEHGLKKQGFSNLKDLLDDPSRTTSLVLVSALVPPGARKGEPVDLQITLPDESKTTSLKGGVLLACELVDYDTTGNLQALAKQGRPGGPSGNLLLGNVWVRTIERAPVVAGSMVPAAKAADAPAAGDRPDAPPDTEPSTLRAGVVRAGGRVTQARPYFFLMRPGDQNIRMAATVAERLNATFQSTADPHLKVAETKTRDLVVVNVPYAYRHNHYRFMLVSRQVPIVPVAADSLYRRRLEEELHDPATALTAAVKLEALGGDARRALRVALENASPWVRFAAAESLAYLGHTDGATELAKLAQEHPALRASCLKALAATDDAAFTDRLVDLMAGADPVLRYGAFVALRLADESHPAVRGQMLNSALWVHSVAAGSPGLVHLTSDRRSEVVLFGDGVRFRGPVPPLPVGPDFTVSMAAGDPAVKVTRIVRVNGEPQVKEAKCSADVHAVLVAMSRLGGGYAEAVELLRRADGAQVLSAAVVVDALPLQMTVQQLAGYAKADPALVKADAEVARVGTLRTDLETAGLDVASDQDPDAKPAEGATQRPPLSRNPGRIFGPKPPPEAPIADPLPPVVPTTGVTPAPADPAPTKVPELSRSPGTLFPRK
ncbi:MAG: hypothetical protein JWO38_8040 [Gemmataceae bacterium]|nr:hypothetical protein [Gemmataceae bacterium]